MTGPIRLVEMRPAVPGRSRGLVSPHVSEARVLARIFEAPDPQRPWVARYWGTRWDLRGQAPHGIEVLGDPAVHVVIEAQRSRVVGPWTRLWTRILEGQGRIRAVQLRGGAVRAFVARPARELTNHVHPLAAVFDVDVGALEAHVLDPDDEAEALPRLAAWLDTQHVDHDAERLAHATALVDRIAADRDLTRVEALATDRHGVRWIQRLFRDYVGVPPKGVIRRHRLQEVALKIEAGEAPCLATLALGLGYADQAHLARDFKDAVGQTLRQFEAHLAGDDDGSPSTPEDPRASGR